MTEENPVLTKEDISSLIANALADALKKEIPAVVNAAITSHNKRQKVEVKEEPVSSEKDPLLAKLDQLEKKYQISEKARKDAERKSATKEAHSQLSSLLSSSNKLRPDAVPTALKLLAPEIQISDTGEVSFGLEGLSLEDAASQFLTSNEAKLFMPAPSSINGKGGKFPTSQTATDPVKQKQNELIGALPGLR